MERTINRILNSATPRELKILKLQNLALRAFPSSPNQRAVIAAYKALEAERAAELKAMAAKIGLPVERKGV